MQNYVQELCHELCTKLSAEYAVKHSAFSYMGQNYRPTEANSKKKKLEAFETAS